MNRIGLEDLLSETVSRWFADWWWLIVIIVVFAILRAVAPGKRSRRNRKKGSRRTGRRQRRAVSGKSFAARPDPVRRVENPARTITGKAYVTDGDGIRVARQEVRIAGIDAPEWNQKAKHRDGYWFKHGERVKSALIQEIGGKHVTVTVENVDKFERQVGTVTHKGRDIGEWLVENGHAIAAYSDRYKHIEQEARKAKRGMWAHAHNFDPRAHRRRERRKD